MKLIELLTQGTGPTARDVPVFVNPDHVVKVSVSPIRGDQDQEQTQIEFVQGLSLTVVGSVADVVKLLTKWS